MTEERTEITPFWHCLQNKEMAREGNTVEKQAGTRGEREEYRNENTRHKGERKKTISENREKLTGLEMY